MPSRVPPADVAALRQGAHQVLLGNLKQGRDPKTKLEFAYICPSRTHYRWQWFWDSCFHAIALSHLDVKVAQRELRNLWKLQRPDGFIPHIIFWGARFIADAPSYWQSKLSWRPKTSALMQPPVLAQAALAVAQRSQDRQFAEESADHLKRYYLFLHDHRDPDGDNLISVITPYETGMDYLPAYDSALGAKDPSRLGLQVRGRLLDLHNWIMGRNYNLDVIFRRDRFSVEDVLVNCVYAQGLRAAAKLFTLANDEPCAVSFTHMAERTERAILEKQYDPETGAFWGLAGKEERRLKVLTVASLLPLVLESIPADRVEMLVKRYLTSEEHFWLPYPVPSVARSEPSFRADEQMLIWRGPTWISTNWFIVNGLRRHGYRDVADDIVARTAQAILKSGFREYYNPLTGEGYGASDFGWSTLIVDMV